MPVYIDHARLPFRGRLMSHMAADTLEELHDMAERIGMERRWFQCPPKTRYPHHDVDETRRALALSYGAHAVSNKALLHYAAKLGTEWYLAQDPRSTDIDIHLAYYAQIMRRTEKYALREQPE